MEVSQEYRVCKFFLNFVGLWPGGNIWRRRATAVFFILQKVYYIESMAAYCYFHWQDGIPLSDVMAILIVGSYVVGYSIIWPSIPKIRELLSHLNTIDEVITDERERKIISDYAVVGYKSSLIFSGTLQSITLFGCLVEVASIIMSFFDLSHSTRVKLILVPVEYFFFDPVEHLVVTNFLIMWVIIFGIGMVCGYTSLFIVTVKQACGFFAVTCHRLRELSPSPKENGELPLNSSIFLHQSVKDAVILHNQCIKSCRMLQEVFCWGISVYVAMFVTMMSFCLFFLINSRAPLIRHTMIGQIAVNSAFFLYFCNWNGQQIINHCESTFEAAYDSSWYLMEPKIRKLISIIMSESTQAYVITGARILPFSMETFASLTKLSLTYVTVLKSVTGPQAPEF